MAPVPSFLPLIEPPEANARIVPDLFLCDPLCNFVANKKSSVNIDIPSLLYYTPPVYLVGKKMKPTTCEIKLAPGVGFHEFVPLETMVIPCFKKKVFFYMQPVD